MLLLHISDIHFRAPLCLKPEMDPDLPYRTALINDIRERISELGPVDAILLGGDVAFQGLPEEYEAARLWLGALMAAADCRLERVFVIPGNHDVDWGVIRGSPTVRNAQQAIIRAEPSKRERVLLEQFSHEEATSYFSGRSAPLGQRPFRMTDRERQIGVSAPDRSAAYPAYLPDFPVLPAFSN